MLAFFCYLLIYLFILCLLVVRFTNLVDNNVFIDMQLQPYSVSDTEHVILDSIGCASVSSEVLTFISERMSGNPMYVDYICVDMA